MRIDEVEKTQAYKDIEKELNEKIDYQLALRGYKNKHVQGLCHLYWKIKKDILKSDYNIDWKSPQELNPEDFFD